MRRNPFFPLTLIFLISGAAGADGLVTNLHVQSTIVSQEHGGFNSPYEGKNSLSPDSDRQTSTTFTVFGGVRVLPETEFYINPELAGGSGFNRTTGIAGFPNAEIYRVDDPSPKWNLARLYLKQVFGLGGEREDVKDDKNQIPGSLDTRRFTVVFGKFALNDFLDDNTYSHDPRTQFLNWTLMDHGAWDYAADTRGYSWGLFLELNQPTWAIRWASVLEPVMANQMEMDTNFAKTRGDNLEFEYRYARGERPGTIRMLAFENHADMGNYRTTIDARPADMDITKSRAPNVKYGFGLNFEQQVGELVGVFARGSWNDGHTETWAFTEIDHTLSAGVEVKGAAWRRANDRAAAAVVVNGLSLDHRTYLANGGYGFIVGDGKLNYAPEEIGECYYLLRLMPGLDITGDYQFVYHPAFNADRGPVSILSARLHFEI